MHKRVGDFLKELSQTVKSMAGQGRLKTVIKDDRILYFVG